MKKLLLTMAVALFAATGFSECLPECTTCNPKNKTEELAKKFAAGYSSDTESQADLRTYVTQKKGDLFRVIVFDTKGTGWDASKGLNKTFTDRYEAWGYAYSLALRYKDQNTGRATGIGLIKTGSATISVGQTMRVTTKGETIRADTIGPDAIDSSGWSWYHRLADLSEETGDWKTIDYHPLSAN